MLDEAIDKRAEFPIELPNESLLAFLDSALPSFQQESST